MTLQGPHQVAKASRMTTLWSLMADSKSGLLLLVSTHPNNRVRSEEASIPSEIVDTHIDSGRFKSSEEGLL
jgi:hypothetical protein